MSGKIRRSVLVLLVNLTVFVLLVSLFEGCASLVLFLHDFSAEPPMGERLHTRYDAELGWVNIPNLSLPDFYGTGASLHTNARGFRGRQAVASRAPKGQRRIICSGDSFTLGFGVADEDTWCHQLGESAPHLQTVNMGQGGYGAGQSFLWYQRDALDVEHDLHLFSFIWDDFRRMMKRRFVGYAKPRVVVSGSELAVENVPVPRTAYYAPWLLRNFRQIGKLSGVQLTTRAARRLGLAGAGAPDEGGSLLSWSPEEAKQVLSVLFRELKELNDERSSELVLVFLPTMIDYSDRTALGWSQFIHEEAIRLGIPFVDLVTEFRTKRPKVVDGMFLKPGEVDFAYADGHYNARGNRLIAKMLGTELAKIPQVTKILAPDPSER